MIWATVRNRYSVYVILSISQCLHEQQNTWMMFSFFFSSPFPFFLYRLKDALTHTIIYAFRWMILPIDDKKKTNTHMHKIEKRAKVIYINMQAIASEGFDILTCLSATFF